MEPPFDALTIHRAETEYHRQQMDQVLFSALERFLRAHLLPQVTINFDRVSGSFGPYRKDEHFCGPNSLVKDKYQFECTFRRGEVTEEIRSALVFHTNTLSFSPAGSNAFRLRTVQMKRERAEALRKINETLQQVQEEGLTEANCPLCDRPLNIVNDRHFFVRCETCF